MSRQSPNQFGGHFRHLGGDRWRLYVDGPRDPLRPRKRNQITRVVRAVDEAAAQRELARLQLDLESGRSPERELTYAEVFDRFLEKASRKLTRRVVNEYRNVTRLHVLPVLGKLRISAVTADDVDDAYTGMLEKGLSPAYVRKAHSATTGCLGFAKRRGLVDVNVAELVELPHVAAPDPYAPELPVVQAIFTALEELKGYVGDDLRVLITLKTVLGARRGELAALRWSDFDLDAGVCTIRRALTYIPGEGLDEKDTKEEDVRPLTIDAPIVALLRAHRARQAEVCLAMGARFDDTAYVFHRPGRPDKPVHLEDHTRRFGRFRKRVAELAGEPVTLRSLRAFVATELLQDGTNVVDVAARLGNTPGTIYKYYAAKRPASDKDVMARMRRKLGG